ncbi:MAG TPA: hypothetical protein VK158_05730 [Acidobacteriota bacterium]|nr:hypothetical protein [Acidobacteriota bacterium]
MQASAHMQQYLENIDSQVKHIYEIAAKARSQGFDSSLIVDVKLAKNLAERVVGLISVIAPQIAGTGIVERIIELEKQYGTLDWRVAMVIAHEIAEQKFVEFPTKKEAIEIGIRVGFAYVTVGVVSSPLEGFTSIEIKKRRDGKGEFFTMNFAGPVRNAGGTAAAVSVVIADYVRKKLGYATYDADEKECNRCHTELMDYHERVTNLQYVPSKEEVLFMVKSCPIEISGDASEKFEVSNYKDLPRIPTNRLRSGYCLIHSSCIPLKAPKLWKNISKWVDAMGMEDWKFLDEFLQIQKKAKSSSTTSTSTTSQKATSHIYPIYTYMADLVGGRPVISHPLRPGGLRLRYGRSRVSGFSAQAMHPATMFVMDDFIAIGTQLKVERPGKATTIVSCDSIDGPTVLLDDGSVEYLESVEHAKAVSKRVKQILYLGDVLICYGDFADRAHTLMPAGYCEEWWSQELEKVKATNEKREVNIDDVLPFAFQQQKTNESLITKNKNIIYTNDIQQLIERPLVARPLAIDALKISLEYNVPLHPKYIPFWRLLSTEQFTDLIKAIAQGSLFKIDDPLYDEPVLKCRFPAYETVQKSMQILGIPHKVPAKEFIVIDHEWTTLLFLQLGIKEPFHAAALVEKFENFQKENQANVESNELGSHVLDFINKQSIVKIRDKAGIFIGARMGRPEKAKMRKMVGFPYNVAPQEIKIKEGKEEKTEVVTEHAVKAELRQKFGVNANKDGSIRYDASEAPLTHFKPSEVDVPVAKLIELGYTKDIHGKPLVDGNQVLELFPQDIVIPCCTVSPNEPADEVMFRAASFVDALLQKLYNLPPYYNLKTKQDLVGQLVFGLAPHTSAATAGRIVGFSKSQPMYCHPMFHAAMRRDCDGDESCFFLLLDGLLNFSTKYLPQHRGGTMDAPLVLTSIINPSEVDDMYFNIDIAWKYPLEFYEAGLQFKKPWDVKIKQANSTLNKPEQFEGMGFTHDTSDFNLGVLCSAYKTLPSMDEKVNGQMALAEKIAAVDASDVAQIVINKHFLRDIMGNLRKFSQQEFRCSKCNEKFRRPPISGKCKCGSTRIIFTISKGSVIKYLDMSINLGKKYNISPYLKQCLEILKYRVDGVFGKDKEKQTGLGTWV